MESGTLHLSAVVHDLVDNKFWHLVEATGRGAGTVLSQDDERAVLLRHLSVAENGPIMLSMLEDSNSTHDDWTSVLRRVAPNADVGEFGQVPTSTPNLGPGVFLDRMLV